MSDLSYADLIAEDAQDRESQLRLSLQQGMKQDPEAAAKAQALARSRGIPSDTAARHLPQLQAEADAEKIDYSGIIANNESLADFLSNPDNAAIAHDDIGALSKIGNYGRAFVGDAVQSLAAGASGLASSIDAGAVKLRRGAQAAGVPEGVIDFLDTEIPGGRFMSDTFRSEVRGAKNYGESLKPAKADRTFGTDVAGAVGQVATNILTFLANPTVSTGLMFGQGADQQTDRVNDARAKGKIVSNDEEANAVLLGGAATALTERVELGFIMKGIPVVGKLVSKLPPALQAKWFSVPVEIGAAGLAEGSQEVIEGLLHDTVEYYSYNPDVKFLQGIRDEFAVSGAAGAFARTLVMAIGGVRKGMAQERVVGQAETLKSQAQAARESKTAQRSPDKFKDYIRKMQGDGSLYMSPDAGTTFYQSLTEDDKKRLDEAMPDFSARVEEARMTGADIEVGHDEYLAHIAPLDAGETLAEHLKRQPDGFSAAEAMEMQDEVEEMMAPSEGEALERRLYDELLNANTPPDMARTQVRKFRAAYETLSERVGENPELQRMVDEAFGGLSIQQDSLKARAKFDDLDLMIGETQAYYRSKTRDKRKADLLGEKGKKKEAATPRPLLNYLIEKGGIDRYGMVAGELRNIGITPENTSRLFSAKAIKDGGTARKDIDNLVAAEFNNAFSDRDVVAVEDGNGYIDRNWLLEQLRDESFGRYHMTAQERERAERIGYYEEIYNTVGRAGFDLLSSTKEDIRRALEQQDSDEDSRTLFQADKTVAEKYRQDLAIALGTSRGQNTAPDLKLGMTPLPLQAVGMEALPVLLKATKLRKTVADHVVPRDVYEALPELLQDPLAIVKNTPDPKTGADRGFIVFLDRKNEAGRDIIATIRKADGRYNVIATVFDFDGKPNRWPGSKILYVRDEKVSLTGLGANSQGGGSITNVLTKAEIVNRYGNKTLFQGVAPASAEGLQSALLRAAQTLKQAKGSGEQMLAALRNTPGVKEEEIAWTGLEEFVKGKKSVTKDEVVSYLEANQVKIEEVTLGAPNGDSFQVSFDEQNGEWIAYDDQNRVMGAGETEEAARSQATETASIPENPTKFAQYTLPGGENYREVLLTLPTADKAEQFLNEMRSKYGDKVHSGMLPKEVEQYQALKKEGRQDNFKSTHFDQPNILAHVRVNDRTDADGKRVLFVEEIQSDWHQAGRKKGYKVREEVNPIEPTDLNDPDNQTYKFKFLDNVVGDYLYFKTEAEAKAAQEEWKSDNTSTVGVPDAPFKKSWHEMAFRRIAQMAAEGGYDRVAWTTGDQQNDRFDLSKQVSRIEYKKSAAEDLWTITVIGKDGVGIVSKSNWIPLSEVEELVGKDMAQKIADNEGEQGGLNDSFDRVLKGDGLKIGGDGMKGFYDKILPAYAKKFGKKFGAAVGETKIDAGKKLEGEQETMEGRPIGVKETKSGMLTIEMEGTDTGWGMWSPNDRAAAETHLKKLQARYDATPPATVHSLDITPAMRESAKAGFELFQDDAKGARGKITFSGDKAVITLFKNKNLSTLLHESGHFYWNLLNNLAEMPNAPDQIKKDAAAMRAWVKAEAGATLSVEQEEQIARGFEAYLMEGKAPSIELRDSFRRFKAWLLRIYKSAVGLNVQLTDDVRGVFDRMLATDAAIDRARRNPVFQPDPQIMEMLTQAEQDKYVKKASAALDEARETLFLKALRQETRKQTKWWKDNWAQVEAEQASILNKQNLYRTIFAVTKGMTPDGQQLDKKLKLDRKKVEAMIGKEMAKQMPAGSLERDGVDPALVADLFNMGSANEMLFKMAEAEPYKARLKDMTEEIMRARFGDMLNDGTIEREALEALHSDLGAAQTEAEFHATLDQNMKFADRPSRYRPKREVFENMAQGMIDRTQISKIQPHRYYRAEVRAAKKAGEAIAVQDWKTAANAKKQQLLNHYLFKIAKDELADIDKRIAKWARLDKPDADLAKTLDMDYVYAVRYVLSKHGIGKVSDYSQWEEQLQREDPGKLEELKAEMDIHTLSAGDYRDMDLYDFEGLADSVDHMISKAKTNKLVSDGKETMQIEDLIGIFRKALDDHYGGRVVSLTPSRDGNPLVDFINALLESGMQINTIIEKLDGGVANGIIDRFFRQMIRDGEARGALMGKDAADKLLALMNKSFGTSKVGQYTTTQENLTSKSKAVYVRDVNRSFTREQIIGVALNWGNEDNRLKLRMGNPEFGGELMGDDGILAVLKKMRKQDWEFVQGVWDLIDSYWPEIAALERRTKGAVPTKVQASPFTAVNEDGEVFELRGGYYPMKYEQERNIKVSENSVNEEFKHFALGRNAAAATRRGHTKERVANVQLPVRLDAINVIREHLSSVVRDLAMREPIQNTNKILTHKMTRQAFQDTTGPQMYRIFDIWLKDTAVGRVMTGSKFSRFMAGARHSTSVAAMGWKISTALVQITGLSQSVVELRPKWAFRGLQRSMQLGLEAADYVQEKSEYMRARGLTFNRDVGDAIKRLEQNGILRDVQATYMLPMLKMQQVVDTITWLGAYEKALADERPAGDPVKFADLAVENAQGSGAFSAMSPILRGTLDGTTRLSETVKLCTVFMSYFNTKVNVAMRRTNQTDFKKPEEVARLGLDYLMLFWFETIVGDFILGKMPDFGDDDEPVEAAAVYSMKAALSTFMAGLPVLREASAYYSGFGTTPPHVRGIESTAAALKNVGSVISDKIEGEDTNWYKVSRSLVDAGVYWSPVKYPAGQINVMIKAMEESSEGGDVSPADYLVAPPRK